MKNITIAILLMASPVMAQESIRMYNPPVGAVGVLKSGDTMTGPLTTTSMTVAGNGSIGGSSFSVGTSTFVVVGGKVGVGTASPAFSLDVKSPSVVASFINTVGGGFIALQFTGDAESTFGALSTNAGSVNIGGRAANLLGVNPALSIDATATSGIKISAAGSVGIGTLSPATKLHVSSGTFTLDGTGSPAAGGPVCFNAAKALSKCTSAVDASGNCTCP